MVVVFVGGWLVETRGRDKLDDGGGVLWSEVGPRGRERLAIADDWLNRGIGVWVARWDERKEQRNYLETKEDSVKSKVFLVFDV